MKYVLDESGYVKIWGTITDGVEIVGGEPFINANEGDLWRFVEGEWVNEKAGYKYFLIPSDFVPNIGNYSGFVKEAHFHLSFNVRVNEVATVVEGIDVSSPLFINFIPCSCTRWTDEGLQLLEAVIDYWNSSNPLK